MRILVIRRDNVGDLVCTTPFLAALRSRYPGAHIAALVNSYNAGVLHGNPAIDAVDIYTKLKHRLPGESRVAILAARFRMLARLRREVFDYVVLAKAEFDRQGLSLARLLRRRQIVGFVTPSHRAARHITTAVQAPTRSDLHEVQRLALLAEAMDVHDAEGPLRVYPSAARSESWRQRLPALRACCNWVGLHISARERERRWPAARCAALIDRLTDSDNGVLLLWAPGAADNPAHPGDDEKAAEIMALVRKGSPVIPARTTSISELIAVLALCRAFIGADGGAVHLAAGLGLPMVALFENLESKKKRWHPWKVPYEMVAPQTREIADIAVEQVMEAWQRLAKRLPAGDPRFSLA